MVVESKTLILDDLPDFLRISVEKGLLDECTARRVELYRRTRGSGEYGKQYPLLNAMPDPSMTFSSFVRLRGNAFALELAQIVVANPPTQFMYNPLYMYGEVGLGKTHLLSAIANGAAGRRSLMINTVDLAAEFVRAKRTHFEAELREWLVSMEILLVDDIQLCEGNDDLQRELFSVLNHMTGSGRWVVISSDVYPTKLKAVELRLLSRLRGGVIVGLQMPDWTERLDILQHFLGDRHLSQDVLEYVAKNMGHNVRQLKAAVSQLLALGAGTRSEITLEMASAVADQADDVRPLQDRDSEYSSGGADSTEVQPHSGHHATAQRFKEMVAASDTEEEQSLALQIALGERIRQMRKEGADAQSLSRLELALKMLREGDMEGATKCLMV